MMCLLALHAKQLFSSLRWSVQLVRQALQAQLALLAPLVRQVRQVLLLLLLLVQPLLVRQEQAQP
jgi:hypothetical protein